MRIVVEFLCGKHLRKSSLVKSDYYCPMCGKKSLWREDDGGDYYIGETYYCGLCGQACHLPFTPAELDEHSGDIRDKIQKAWSEEEEKI